MAYTKSEIRQIALAAPIVGFISAAGVITPLDSIIIAVEKLDGNIGQLQQQVGAIQAGNNLFLYYNFK